MSVFLNALKYISIISSVLGFHLQFIVFPLQTALCPSVWWLKGCSDDLATLKLHIKASALLLPQGPARLGTVSAAYEGCSW